MWVYMFSGVTGYIRLEVDWNETKKHVSVRVIDGHKLPAADSNGLSDPYVAQALACRCMIMPHCFSAVVVAIFTTATTRRIHHYRSCRT
jgi:hypothetical protein